METLTIDLQLIRKSVLHSQLLALEAQAQAMYFLTTEHQDGIDLGRNPEIYLTVQQVKEVADEARKLVDSAADLDPEAVLTKLSSLQNMAVQAVERAGAVVAVGEKDADCRLTRAQDHCQCHKGNKSNRAQLQTDADRACCRAEKNQYQGFKIQVQAICDLALELSFTAAAGAGHKYPTDSKYWQGRF